MKTRIARTRMITMTDTVMDVDCSGHLEHEVEELSGS